MLKYFFDYQLVHYPDKKTMDWREAIAESCPILIDKEIIDEAHVEEIIHCVGKYGPHIMIIPQVIMPHSSEKSNGVFGTAISSTKLKQPIRFESEGKNEEKAANLFFTFAAKDPEGHLENIRKLSELLMTDGLVEHLISTNSIDDYRAAMTEYNQLIGERKDGGVFIKHLDVFCNKYPDAASIPDWFYCVTRLYFVETPAS